MMESRWLYLLIDAGTISLPLAFSFYPKANFSRKWKYLLPSIAISAAIFLIWDEWFTRIGVWGFNPRYLSGLYLGHLPLEEVLFFVCVPYSCVFTYEAVGYFLKNRDPLAASEPWISWILAILLLLVGAVNYTRWYCAITFGSLGVFLIAVRLKFGNLFLSRFYFAYLFILIQFVIVNGLLTGTGIDGEVVWYNNGENMGIRMGTIPVEDTFYGMLLILMNVTLFEWFQKKHQQPGASLLVTQ